MQSKYTWYPVCLQMDSQQSKFLGIQGIPPISSFMWIFSSTRAGILSHLHLAQLPRYRWSISAVLNALSHEAVESWLINLHRTEGRDSVYLGPSFIFPYWPEMTEHSENKTDLSWTWADLLEKGKKSALKADRRTPNLREAWGKN